MTLSLGKNSKRILLHYFLFSVGFIFLHISFVSVFTFFHFLLDHDMSTIENWLNRNSWEILIVSKGISCFFISKIFQINTYQDVNPIKKVLINLKMPSKKVFGMSFFLLGIINLYLFQIEGGTLTPNFQEDLFYSSFIGAFFYYLFDFILLILLYEYIRPPAKEMTKIVYISTFIFILSSKVAMPYLSKYYIFILIHFLTLFFLYLKGSFVDCLVYSFLVIAPLSSIYGLDLVWDNSYGLFHFSKETPIIGFLGIWCLALGYYRFSRLN